MSGLDGIEDDDDTFYYEVEEIIQMIVTDNGVRMFEIKWKNYDSLHNTWEPEHNLNCPSILKAFFEKHGIDPTPFQKKKRTKKKSRSVEVTEAEATTTTTASSTTTTTTTAESVPSVEPDTPVVLTEEERETEEAGRRKAERKLKKQKRREEKRLNKLLEERKAWEKATIDNKKAKEDNKQRRLTIAQGTDLIEKARQLSGIGPSDQQIEEEEEKRRLAEKRQVDEIKKANALRKAEMEYQKAAAQRKAEEGDEPAKVVSTKPFISNNQRIKSDEPFIPNNQRNKTDESFTAIKRTVNAKPPSTGGVDILKLVESIKQPLAISKYPQQRPTSTVRPPFNYPPPSHHSPSKLVPPKQLPPKPPLPKPTPPAQPPPTPVPTPPAPPTRNPPVTTMERLDPRRQRENQPEQQQQPTVYEPITIKRQFSNSKDPRMNADNFKKIKLSNSTALATPFELDTLLYNGNKFIASVKVEGKQTCYHEAQIMKLISQGDKNEIRAMFTVPLKALNTILCGRPISFMNIIPKDNLIYVSKLKSYYQVNEMAGVVHHPDMNQAIVLLAEDDLKKLSNLPTDTGLGIAYNRLCAIFIDDLVERPKCLSKEIVYDTDSKDYTTPYTWNLVAEYLKFPEELNQLKNKAKFVIYGSSESSQMLIRASGALKTSQHGASSYVMMFDRFGEMYFNRNLSKHKKEAATRMWEFGVPDFSYGDMIPAKEIFPKNSGGFVTTDMSNLSSNPLIIQTIHSEIKKLNAMPTVHGQWSFILPHNWLYCLKMMVLDHESGQRVKEAIVAISIGLSNDSVQIVKLWCAEDGDFNHIHFMDRVAHNNYQTHQYFVYVDDIASVSPSHYINSLEFVPSSKIYSNFS